LTTDIIVGTVGKLNLSDEASQAVIPQFVDIGVRLRRAREILNVTIEQLSQRTGISKTALSAYERGTRMPDPAGWNSDASKLCNELEIGMDWLYRGDQRWVMSKGTLSEKVAEWRRVQPHFKEAAKQRQREHGGTRPGKTARVSTDSSRLRDDMKKITGYSGRTIEKAMAIVEAAEADPAKYGKLVEEMDKSGANGTYKKLREMQAAQRKRAASRGDISASPSSTRRSGRAAPGGG
jgi:transcriptional regulator with XRE-family HTH domain